MPTRVVEPMAGLVGSTPPAAAPEPAEDAGRQFSRLPCTHPKALPNSRLPLVNRLRPKESFTSYHKPIRSETPTPSASAPATSVWPPTPSAAGPDMGVVGIGMALGSPTHPPDYAMEAPFQPSVTTKIEALGASKDHLSKGKPKKWAIFTRTRSKRDKATDARPRDNPTGSQSSGATMRTTPSTDGAQGARDDASSPWKKPLAKARTEPVMGESTASSRLGLTRRGIPGSLGR